MFMAALTSNPNNKQLLRTLANCLVRTYLFQRAQELNQERELQHQQEIQNHHHHHHQQHTQRDRPKKFWKSSSDDGVNPSTPPTAESSSSDEESDPSSDPSSPKSSVPNPPNYLPFPCSLRGVVGPFSPLPLVSEKGKKLSSSYFLCHFYVLILFIYSLTPSPFPLLSPPSRNNVPNFRPQNPSNRPILPPSSRLRYL